MEWVSTINLGSSAGNILLLLVEEGINQLRGGEDDTKSRTTTDPAESMLTGDITKGTFIIRSMPTTHHFRNRVGRCR